MRIQPFLLLALTAPQASAQFSPYARPDVVSPNPAVTFQDNIVTPYAELPTSPIQLIYQGDLPAYYAIVGNSRRGRFEIFYDNGSGWSPVNDLSIPIGATAIVPRPGSSEWWIACPNTRTDVDPATGTAHAGGVITVLDSVSGVPVRTIAVGKGPSDIAFHPSGDVAWVSCRYSKDVHVVDCLNGASTAAIDLDQFTPHAIEFLPATNEVLVASLLSGNNTASRGEFSGDPIPDVVGHLPTDPAPQGNINVLPDRDVVVLHVNPANPLLTTPDSTDSRLATGVMTIQYNLKVDPHASRAFVVGTEALNAQVRGEKNFIAGQVVENRLVMLDYSGGGTPVQTTVNLDGQAVGPMATPTDFVVSPTDPARAWLVASGVDRVVEFDISGPTPVAVGAWQIQAGSAFGGSLVGARLADINQAGDQLIVFCQIENSLVSIDVTNPPTGLTTVTTSPLIYDPLPDSVKRGWGHAADANRSASKTSSCNSCHVDGGSDNLVWDLSKWHDPEGTPAGQLAHEQDDKGPMLTQVLFGLPEVGPYHWRGEQHNLREFNGTFVDLFEGSLLTSSELDELVDYMSFLRHAPNPHLALDRTYANSSSPGGTGDAQTGLNEFRTFGIFGPGTVTCAQCHQLPLGTNNQIQNLRTLIGPPAPAAQVAQLRGVVNRLDEGFQIGGWYGERSRNGAGLVHHAGDPSFEHFLNSFGGVNADQTVRGHMEAFLEVFDTGLAPATAFVRVLRSDSANPLGDYTATMAYVVAQSALGNADFTALLALTDGQGTYTRYPMFYDRGLDAFVFADPAIPHLTRQALEAFFVGGGPPITVLGHPPGSGHRWAIDTDDDQLLDGDESVFGNGPSPFDPDSDGDGFPDGYEATHNTDPMVSDASVGDGTGPVVLGYRQQIASTNTLKLELNTNEPCRVRALLTAGIGGATLDVEPIGLASPATGGYTTNHQVVAGGLLSRVELPFFPVPFTGLTLLPVKIEAIDPSGNITTTPIAVLMGERDHAVRVQSISQAVFVPGVGGAPPSADFQVDLGVGTLPELVLPTGPTGVIPEYPLPPATPTVPEPVWELKVKVSYGTRPGGPGTQVIGLTQLLTPSGGELHLATQSNSSGAPTFNVTLPVSAATDTNRVLLVSVDDVFYVAGSGGMQHESRGFTYIETQAYKRHHQVLSF